MTKIMVVDDDKDATSLFEEVLKAEGYEPILLNESSKAVQLAKKEMPALFILDLMMPGLNGYELCEILHKDPMFSNTPIVIISAKDDAESKQKALVAGARDYITKPFDVDEFLEKIKIFTTE